MEGHAKKHPDIVPALGRMNAVDADACGQHPDSYARQGPMAAKYASLTPYNYAFNDPVLWNDPSGADPWNNGPYAGSMAYYYAVQLSYGGMSPGQEAIMDPGGGKYSTFGYWDPATAGGYGVQVGAYLNSMGYSGLPGITHSGNTWTIHWNNISNDGGTWSRGLGYSPGIPAGMYLVPIYGVVEVGKGLNIDTQTIFFYYRKEVIGIRSVYFEGTDRKQLQQVQTQGDPYLSKNELIELFRDNFNKEWWDPLETLIRSGSFTSRELIEYVQNFNYSDIFPKNGSWFLAPVQNSMFQVTDPAGNIVDRFDLFKGETGIYPGYLGKIPSGELSGRGLFEFTTSSGFIIKFSIILEGRLIN
jgi:hypothetical protein